MIAAGYYAQWTGDVLPPASVDMSRYDLLFYGTLFPSRFPDALTLTVLKPAFAIPNADYGLDFDDSWSGPILQELVSNAHAAGTKVVISIGGWLGESSFVRLF